MIIGRIEEINKLKNLHSSNKSEFIAVYGRRRVGKTFLINETFGDSFTFKHAGLSPNGIEANGLMKKQLHHFYDSLILHGMKKCAKPKDWFEAFLLLELFLQEKDNGTRQLVFLDELPWMDTPRSGFISALEAFWNSWACSRKNLMLIVCGSANSWIQDKLINNHGGLYNRLTYQIKLSPFTLKECKDYYLERKVAISNYDIVQSYMVFGGIPYYMDSIEPGDSLPQAIDRVLFSRNALFALEFDRLFDSLFSNSETVKKIIRFLAKKNAGYTRAELIKGLSIKDGGTFSKTINALITSDFIIKYVPFGFSKKEEHYKLIDPFCLFYLHFVEGRKADNETYWLDHLDSQEVVVWRGFAFENVCFNHVNEIKKALGISGVSTNVSAWSKKPDDEKGIQIDLLLERKDNIINMCELKFYKDEFVVNKDYYRTILRRQDMILEKVSPRVAVHSTLITTFGLKRNEYSNAFNNVITLDDLFS